MFAVGAECHTSAGRPLTSLGLPGRIAQPLQPYFTSRASPLLPSDTARSAQHAAAVLSFIPAASASDGCDPCLMAEHKDMGDRNRFVIDGLMSSLEVDSRPSKISRKEAFAYCLYNSKLASEK